MFDATKLVTIAENQQRVYEAGYAKGQAAGGGSALPFTESGSVIRCFPHTSYPFTLVANADCEVKHCGKNLFSTDMVRAKIMYFDEDTGLWTIDTKALGGPGAAYASLLVPAAGLSGTPTESDLPKCIRVPENTPITFTLNDYSVYTSDGSTIDDNADTVIIRLYKIDGSLIDTIYRFYKDTSSISFLTPKETAYLDIRRANAIRIISFSTIQIEIGANPTTYEPYSGEIYTLTANEPIGITPFEGSNYLVTDNGEITVSGRLNTQAMYEVLTLN